MLLGQIQLCFIFIFCKCVHSSFFLLSLDEYFKTILDISSNHAQLRVKRFLLTQSLKLLSLTSSDNMNFSIFVAMYKSTWRNKSNLSWETLSMNQRSAVCDSAMKLISDQKVIFGDMHYSLVTIWAGVSMSTRVVWSCTHNWVHLNSNVVTDHKPMTITCEPIIMEHTFISNKTLNTTFLITKLCLGAIFWYAMTARTMISSMLFIFLFFWLEVSELNLYFWLYSERIV